MCYLRAFKLLDNGSRAISEKMICLYRSRQPQQIIGQLILTLLNGRNGRQLRGSVQLIHLWLPYGIIEVEDSQLHGKSGQH